MEGFLNLMAGWFFFGLGIPLHRPYPYSEHIGEDCRTLHFRYLPEMFGDLFATFTARMVRINGLFHLLINGVFLGVKITH